MCVQITYHLNLIYQYFKIGCLENIEPIDILDIKVIQSNYWGRWPLFLCSFVSFCKAIFLESKLCMHVIMQTIINHCCYTVLQFCRMKKIMHEFSSYPKIFSHISQKYKQLQSSLKWKNVCSARGCVIKAKSTSFFWNFFLFSDDDHSPTH